MTKRGPPQKSGSATKGEKAEGRAPGRGGEGAAAEERDRDEGGEGEGEGARFGEGEVGDDGERQRQAGDGERGAAGPAPPLQGPREDHAGEARRRGAACRR